MPADISFRPTSPKIHAALKLHAASRDRSMNWIIGELVKALPEYQAVKHLSEELTVKEILESLGQ